MFYVFIESAVSPAYIDSMFTHILVGVEPDPPHEFGHGVSMSSCDPDRKQP